MGDGDCLKQKIVSDRSVSLSHITVGAPGLFVQSTYSVIKRNQSLISAPKLWDSATVKDVSLGAMTCI